MQRIRRTLYGWMRDVLDERGWSAAAWARRAEVTPTNLTRFLKDPERASLPSAETIGRLAQAAGCEPRFLSEAPLRQTGARVPVLTVEQLRRLEPLGPRAAEAFLEEAAHQGGPSVLVDKRLSRRAFALRITSLHMNAGGLMPEDFVILEPTALLLPAQGDLVVTVDGDHVCGYRYHPPLLVPVSSDPACGPVPCDRAAMVGVVIQVVRSLRH